MRCAAQVLRRSSTPADRPAVFAAQFSLSESDFRRLAGRKQTRNEPGFSQPSDQPDRAGVPSGTAHLGDIESGADSSIADCVRIAEQALTDHGQ
jgi:hypothetical protein